MTETPPETRPLFERRHPDRPLVLAIVGPTATGKSALALALADRFGGEIINCDSTAVYRGFDIGTDKLPSRQRRGDSAPPHRHRGPDRGLHGRAVCARRRGSHPRHPSRAADCRSRRRHRLLLPCADPRPVSGAGRGRGAARAAESHRGCARPRAAAPDAAGGWTPNRRHVSCLATEAARAGARGVSTRPAVR